ncbi:DUF2785 domain-containing protein [Levilactobacillus tongjiangensis]|uniref:DUF2785 domain-containing protein n=1 Tax=Levilactobacillus tongjiangensis TaxID=2486023 RepID=A0ABW1SSH2_9LACO|nr:DUF2785 domain-containing protein [Levilactobacillus tongjiangensis]
MDEQIGTLMQELAALNDQVRGGDIYQSLSTRLGKLMDDIHRRRRTAVTLPDDDDGVAAILTGMRHQLEENVPVTLTGEKLDLLLAHLSSTDPKVRYEGINFTVYDALQQDAFDSNQMKVLLESLQNPDGLFNHILEPANVGVFGRAARVAMLAAILHFVPTDNYGEQELRHTVLLAGTYICLETDTRGFVNQQGWAHAFSAATDLLAVLAGNESLPRADKLFLMMTLLERIKRLNTPLIYGENDRMATYFVELVNRHPLYEEAFLLSLKQWRQRVALHRRPDTIAGWNRFFNRKRLLDALRLHGDLPKSIHDYLNSSIDFLG